MSIDHLVALKEAYVSGASSWSQAALNAFGNDVERVGALRVIGGAGNADKDPAEWKPPLQSTWPDYARTRLAVKIAYGLTADQAETDTLRALLAPPPPPPPPPLPPLPETVPAPPTATATTLAPATTRPPTKRPPTTNGDHQASSCHPSYRGQCVPSNVSDVDCAGGQGNGPAYTGRVEVVGPDEYRLDDDSDGIGCENS